MSYERVTPRARQGTTGINTETNLTAGNGVLLFPPDRVAAITIAVNIPEGATGSFTIECSCNRPETIGSDGLGGYWANVYGDGVSVNENTTIMLANAVTAIRVNCIDASDFINVAFCG